MKKAKKTNYCLFLLNNIESYPFDGCGGDVRRLLKTYTEVYQPKR